MVRIIDVISLKIESTAKVMPVCFSGVLSGGSGGGLLPRQCIHRRLAAYAGNDKGI